MTTKRHARPNQNKTQHVRGKSTAKNKTRVSNVLAPDETNNERDGVFLPSERQQRFLQIFLTFGGTRFSITAVCKKAGISRAIYYLWLQNPAFVKWYNTSRQALSDIEIMHIDKVLHMEAKAGNLPAIRTVLEKRGELFKRIDLDVSAGVQVVKDPAALQRLINMVLKMKAPPGVKFPVGPAL